MSITDERQPCAACGMLCKLGQFHPYGACRMFRERHNRNTVRENLSALMSLTKEQRLRALLTLCKDWLRQGGHVNLRCDAIDRELDDEERSSGIALDQPPAPEEK